MSRRRGTAKYPGHRAAKSLLDTATAFVYANQQIVAIVTVILCILFYVGARLHAKNLEKKLGHGKKVGLLEASSSLIKAVLKFFGIMYLYKAVSNIFKRFGKEDKTTPNISDSSKSDSTFKKHNVSKNKSSASKDGFPYQSAYATKLIYERKGTMFVDHDGDFANEFYEEHNGTLMKISKGLKPEGTVKLSHPTINPEIPVVLQSSSHEAPEMKPYASVSKKSNKATTPFAPNQSKSPSAGQSFDWSPGQSSSNVHKAKAKKGGAPSALPPKKSGKKGRKK